MAREPAEVSKMCRDLLGVAVSQMGVRRDLAR